MIHPSHIVEINSLTHLKFFFFSHFASNQIEHVIHTSNFHFLTQFSLKFLPFPKKLRKGFMCNVEFCKEPNRVNSFLSSTYTSLLLKTFLLFLFLLLLWLLAFGRASDFDFHFHFVGKTDALKFVSWVKLELSAVWMDRKFCFQRKWSHFLRKKKMRFLLRTWAGARGFR